MVEKSNEELLDALIFACDNATIQKRGVTSTTWEAMQAKIQARAAVLRGPG